MKKITSILFILIFILVSIMGNTVCYADEEYETENILEFYNCLDGWEINAVTYELSSYGVVGLYCPNECPDLDLYEPFEFVLSDDKGTVYEPKNGIWTLGKGNYEITWTNMDEVKDRLKGWELYDEYTITFPDGSNKTQYFSVDGKKQTLSFYTSISSTMYLLYPESQYIFDPVGDPEVTVVGDYNPDALPDFLGSASKLTYEVRRAGGAVLLDEELKKPLEEGYYMITWNNMDEIKQLVENSNDDFFNNYELVFPDEPLTKKLTITSKPWWDKPKKTIRMLGMYCSMEGEALLDAKELIRISGEYDEDLYNEWIQYVEIEYYDESGRKLEESEISDNMPAGTYTARWVNFYEFQKLDIEKGWGLQDKYFLKDDFDTEYPECEIELCAIDYDPELGSVLGNGTLTVVFGCTTLICLAAIVILASKLKKEKENK